MKLLEIINEFVCNDLDKTIDFYKKYFNFEIVETDGNPLTWCKMKKDDCFIMFEKYLEVCNEISNYPKKTPSCNLIVFKYDNKKDFKELYNKLKYENIKMFMELKDTDYGSLEFGVFDPDNNMIILSC